MNRPYSQLRPSLFIALFTALVIAGAYLHIPLPLIPVPITLQTLFIMLAGLVLGPTYSLLSIILYILLGLVGLPVFAGGASGLAYLLGPTGGFLISFLPAVWLTGMLRSSSKKIIHNTIVCCLSSIVIYLIGVSWLVITNMSWIKALQVGMLPFLLGDIIKNIAAAVLYRTVPVRL